MCLVIGPSFSSVKPWKTRFLDPFLSSTRASLEWFTMAFCALEVELVPPTAGFLVEGFWFPTRLGLFCFILRAGHSLNSACPVSESWKKTTVGGKAHNLPKDPALDIFLFFHVQMVRGKEPMRESETTFYETATDTWSYAQIFSLDLHVD